MEPNQPKPLTRRQREKLQRCNDIVNAAQKRFFERGFDCVSMDDIAADLELSKPALYRYFRNKESLYLAVALRGMELLRDNFKTAVVREETGIGKVQAYLNALCFDYVPKHANYYRVISVAREQRFMDLYKLGKVDGAKEFGNIAFELLMMLVEAIKLGIQDGTTREGLDPLQTALFLVVASEAVTNLSSEYQENLLTNRKISKNTFSKHSIDLMLQGIATPNKK
jgi:TetR/AcrR family transcriptional regulator